MIWGPRTAGVALHTSHCSLARGIRLMKESAAHPIDNCFAHHLGISDHRFADGLCPSGAIQSSSRNTKHTASQIGPGFLVAQPSQEAYIGPAIFAVLACPCLRR